ncbi:hypothetical protein [Massilia sp. NR 4-1]|uniref:hypothetical protein n=1 Tax=Massilia sp. NR 4-1 TaxID=1678028 RepID=UPI00067ACF69|nr:hypothetical protein [Massilia sp. NR 4-1]AKU21955.1 hypothetical protein ACZ75_11240 [Massilia sp. NR 4-1]
MGEITERWKSEECRIEDGIYFEDDTYIALLGHAAAQGARRSIGELLHCEPDNWSAICVGDPLAVSPDYLVFGGETSWEGAGFLAVVRARDGSLIWLLHSSEAEPFRCAGIAGELVVATSHAYPVSLRWEIPIAAPWSLTVTVGAV